MSGEKDKVEPIDKVVVFVGEKERNGISKEISVKIWNIYKKYLGNVEIYSEVPNPMQNASAYARKRPQDKFYAVTGIRGEDDMTDLRRITSFKNRENVQGLVFAAPGGTRATDLRQAVLSGNLDEVRDFFPSELKGEELAKIINMLKQSIISEIMSENIDSLFDSWFSEDITTKEVVVEQAEETSTDFDYKPYMASLLEYMLEQRMTITPLPEIKIKRDPAEAGNFFGRTAYYDPNVKEVVLYVEGRHPKDVMRSFTHEMVHHIQNLEGRLGTIETSNTNESDDLLELEKEAYLTGNITFRNWEDKIKNE